LSDQDTFTAGPTTCLAPSVPLEPVSRMLAMSFGCAPKKVRPRTPWKLRRGIFTACSHLTTHANREAYRGWSLEWL